jgi:hypothetical protein
MRNTCIETEQRWLPHVLVGVLSNFNIDFGALYEASGWIENSYIRRNNFTRIMIGLLVVHILEPG